MPPAPQKVDTLIANAAACAGLVLLAACQAPLPAEQSAQEETHTVHLLRQEPHRAAVCIARNTDKYRGRVIATIREGVAPALVSVSVTEKQPVARVRLFVEGEGSRAEVAMAPLTPERQNAWIAVMLEGC